MVSKMGFAEPGLRMAKHEGVGALSLLPDDPIDAGFSVGILCYAKRYEWDRYEVSVYGKAAGSLEVVTDFRSVLLDGKPVLDWFAKELSTTYMDATGPEPTHIEVKFKTVVTLQIEERPVDATRLTMTDYRICHTKRGFAQVTGDAFYDWQANGISWPIGGKLQFQVTEEMVREWEPFTGEVPSEKEFLGLVIKEFIGTDYARQDVIDLGKYSLGCPASSITAYGEGINPAKIHCSARRAHRASERGPLHSRCNPLRQPVARRRVGEIRYRPRAGND